MLVGYLTGVALLMMAGQLGAATGVPVTGEEFLPQVASFVRHISDAQLATSLITVSVLAFLFAVRAWWPRVPGPLLIDLTALRRLVTFRRGELVITAAAFAGVLVLGILYGVLAAIGVSVAELLVRVARPHDAIQGIVPGMAGMHDIDDYPQARTIPGLVVYRYDAPLFFANAHDFRRRVLAAARSGSRGHARWLVLNVEANVEVDFTAQEALDQVREELARDGTILALARVKQDLLVRLQAFGLAKSIGPTLLFPTCRPRWTPTGTGPRPTRQSARKRPRNRIPTLRAERLLRIRRRRRGVGPAGRRQR